MTEGSQFEYVQATDWNQLANNLKDQDAVIRRLTIISQATKRLSSQFRDSHPEIPYGEQSSSDQRDGGGGDIPRNWRSNSRRRRDLSR